MTNKTSKSGPVKERRKITKAAENTAAFGMLLICSGLLMPFFSITDPNALSPFKWIYSAGAFIYVLSRAVAASDPSFPAGIKRLKRMEFWAGVCFMVAAALWFYQEEHLGPMAGPLAVIRNTILFTLAGAVIQIIATWLIYAREKKLIQPKNEINKNDIH